MKVPLLELDKDQIFVYAGKLWVVEEVVTNTSDIIQYLICKPFTDTRRGTTTIPSAFMATCRPMRITPDTVVTVLDIQTMHEIEHR